MADDTNKYITTNGNVILIDPNNLPDNINTTIGNGIPQYQDMHIYAELTAVRKGRTVLESVGESSNYNIVNTGLNDTVKVSFLGNNQNNNSNDPNYLNFTTNYYDGSVGNEKQYEGFGMTSIKVIINSSFIPQVNIQFVDIRGLAFFNRVNSPYRILFDFPPPTFELTIKGYYGMALKYQLHLVKYTSEFKANNGNYIIDAQFVAVTYAPLSDVLLRYAINFPLINNETSYSPISSVAPRNTNELILKLRNLYANVSKDIKGSKESINYDNATAKIASNSEAINSLNNFRDDLRQVSSSIYLLRIDTSPSKNTSPSYNQTLPYDYITNEPVKASETDQLYELINLSDYNSTIQKFSVGREGYTQENQRLYIAYEVGPSSGTVINSDLNLALIKYMEKLSGENKTRNTQSNLHIDTFNNGYCVSTQKSTSTKYIGIDITDYYVSLYKEKNENIKSKTTSAAAINTKINNAILKELGMIPTIYNIFKIILDDVDTFFRTIRTTAIEAEGLYNTDEYKNIIINYENYVDIKNDKNINSTHLYAFPLIIDNQRISNGNRQVRSTLAKIKQKLPNQRSPEMELINDFIATFFKQTKFAKLYSMRANVDANGNSTWIPISPIDSTLSGVAIDSPYAYDINYTLDNLHQILYIFLDRFYVLTQSSLPISFYNTSQKTISAYINLFAKSEAVNLAYSVFGQSCADILYSFSNKEGKNADSFYKYIYDNNINFSFSEDNKEKIEVSNGKDAFVDKKNLGYEGCAIYEKSITTQKISDTSTDPVNKFFKESTSFTWYEYVLLINHFKSTPESIFDFTAENVFYIMDDIVGNDYIIRDNSIALSTRFLDFDMSLLNALNKKTKIDKLLIQGNVQLENELSAKKTKFTKLFLLNTFHNIIDTWVKQLSLHDDEIFKSIIDTNSKLGALLYLSNFGYTLSPFNIYPKNLNTLIFSFPAAISVPAFLPAYIGALVLAIEGSDPNYTIQTIKDFFITGGGKDLDSLGYYIFADIADIRDNLSENDKNLFRSQFDSFIINQYNNTFNYVNELYYKVKNSGSSLDKRTLYNNYLNPKTEGDNAGSYYQLIIQPLIQRTNIINFSEITFKVGGNNTGYKSLESLNNDKNFNYKEINNKFFNAFFKELSEQIFKQKNKSIEEEKANKKLEGDEDIVSQTYYSFKNINDKWLSTPIDTTSSKGFPFNNGGSPLIDSFAFVDRAMNPIGDTIINAEILLDQFDDPSITIYTALTQLLSRNGFEFFPIQNFMSYNSDSWTNSFKIDTNGGFNQSPAFICMLIAGTSSYPTEIGNGFIEDGIIDLSTTAVTDFKSEADVGSLNSISDEDNKQKTNNPKFPWSQVRAFKVRFGEQNQTMFNDIKIDSKEYPETNESIQILSRLANDNNQKAPVPKGQNLYNLYENRAYKATILGLGNAMIQPTQYFQLENVPLFNGAYIILTVEHTIEPNKMMTNFSGTKILKYPVPRLKNAAAIYGFDGGDSDDTSVGGLSSAEITKPNIDVNNIIISKYDSMSTFKLDEEIK